MAVACASRFAVLKLEDDEVAENDNIQNSKTNLDAPGKNKVGVSKNAGGASEAKSKSKKKKKNASDAELQNLAFGNGRSKSKGGSQASSSRNVSAKQWEEWKKKDSEFVSEAYEQDLQQALLLSKIDYEEKKDVYDALQKEAENNKSCTVAQQKKKKKNTQKKEKGTMSLDEFQSLLPSQIDSGNYSKGKLNALDDFNVPEKHPIPDESDFFDKIEEDAEKIIVREQKQDFYRNMEPQSQDSRSQHFQEEMLKKDEEIKLLTEEVNKLKEELKIVKTRNKKLYGILATGEMREKAEILVQIEQLTSVKDELTDQMNEYHTALEQERSKVHILQAELKKYQSNRKEHRDSK